jgi:cobalt-zinc-cadmium efflux system membrane fusion protein
MKRVAESFCSAATALAMFAGAGACGREKGPEAPSSEAPAAAEAGAEAGVVQLTEEKARALGVVLARAEMRSLETEIQTTGQVDFEQERVAHVTPPISGRVTRVQASLGARVARGEILATLDSVELGQARAEYLQARARTALAREVHDREAKLFADRISSQQELLTARAELLGAEAELQSASAKLRLYGLGEGEIAKLAESKESSALFSIRSPLAGKVVERHIAAGELVTPERDLFTVADLGHVWIWIDVYEKDLRRVHLEDGVRVKADAFPDESFSGTVSYLSDRVDPDSRTVRARLDVMNPDEKLRPGMFARVVVSDPHGGDGGVRPASLAVPESAALREGDSWIVFVAEGANRFRRVAVELGRKAGGYVEILRGLEAGQEVVVEGGFVLKSEAARDQLGEEE